MTRLFATVPILHENRQYEPGDGLPTTDPDYVSAWIRTGSAVWEEPEKGEEKPPEKKKTARARSLTAPAGSAGLAQLATGAEPDLVGRVPGKKARGIVTERDKTAPKAKG